MKSPDKYETSARDVRGGSPFDMIVMTGNARRAADGRTR